MRIFGFDIARKKAVGGDLITHLPTPSAWWPVVRESFAGAWQRSVQTPVEDALTHPTFWACVTLIASDVAKCRAKLNEEDTNGIETEVENAAYSPVLRRPNHYQNRIQFYTYWMLSKLTRGNTYALKERDARGVVTALYLLDPTRVRPLVTPTGDVYYSCQQDILAGVDAASIVVPAREIIHDIAYAPYHPLCGLSPVYAAGHAVQQALMLMRNSSRLFKTGTQTGGIITAPTAITREEQQKIEAWWTENFSGAENIGKVAVLGGGLTFEQPTTLTAVDAELIKQLNWDDEKICACLHVPPYKVAVGPIPSYNNVEALGQEYYGDCLQIHFESLELCLTEGLELRSGLSVEFDLEALNRMDSVQKMDAATKGVVGGVYSPNEARAKFNLKPMPGGETPYLQEQNWPLKLLAGRELPAKAPTAPAPIPNTPPPALPPPPTTMKALDGDALRRAVFERLERAA